MKMTKFIPSGVLLLLAIGIAAWQWNRRHVLDSQLKLIERSQATAITINGKTRGNEANNDDVSANVESPPNRFPTQEILNNASADNRPGYLESVKWQEMETAVFSLPPEEMPNLLDKIVGDGHRHLNSSIVQAIFENWATIDRAAALARIETLPSSLWDGAYQGILTVWSELDPHAAYAFAESAPVERQSYETKFTIEVIEMVAAHDPKTALETGRR